MVGEHSLILTVTRRCNLRCSYCPTVKEGWPSLQRKDVARSIELFEQLYGSGVVKIFGGEPLLEPEICREVIEFAQHRESIRYVYLSTNGLGLTPEWLQWLRAQKKVILTVSIDGAAKDHRRMRRALPGVEDSYDHLVDILPELLTVPRVVVTQTIAPATAVNAAENFAHLCELGFRRFNFLPGYFVPWRTEQLSHLRRNFARIQEQIQQQWREGRYLYVRNLFVRAPTPFFNQGLIVDSDSTIHPSNVGLSGALDHLRAETEVGTLSHPPSRVELDTAASRVNALIQESVSERIWNSTLAADAELTHFCAALLPDFLRHKRSRQAQQQASEVSYGA